MVEIESLEVRGYRNELVPNTFWRQEEDARSVGIVLPGWGYTCRMPLLYYSTKALLDGGSDVLWVEYAYSERPEFRQLPDAEQEAWLLADAAAGLHAALQQREYGRVTLIGKSLGTLAAGHLLATEPSLANALAIWLTPILGNERLEGEIQKWGGRSLFVIGTADPLYDHARLDRIRDASAGEVLLIEGADHSLEIERDVQRSLRDLVRIISGVQAFLS